MGRIAITDTHRFRTRPEFNLGGAWKNIAGVSGIEFWKNQIEMYCLEVLAKIVLSKSANVVSSHTGSSETIQIDVSASHSYGFLST